MKLTELRKMCEQDDWVSLRLPGNGRGHRRRLCGRRGPLGLIICGSPEYQVVQFESRAVLRFLDQPERSDHEQ